MGIALGTYDRKVRGNDRRMFRNVDTAHLCRDALREAYGDEKSVHKAIAEDTGMSPKAAENWTAGENPMSLTAFLNAYHNNPAFKAWARKLLLMESELDPEFERELHSFIRAAQRFGGNTEASAHNPGPLQSPAGLTLRPEDSTPLETGGAQLSRASGSFPEERRR